MKEICWKPLGVALAVVFGFLMLFFCILSYITARKIKGFDDDDDTTFDYRAPALRPSPWANVTKMLKKIVVRKRSKAE